MVQGPCLINFCAVKGGIQEFFRPYFTYRKCLALAEVSIRLGAILLLHVFGPTNYKEVIKVLVNMFLHEHLQ